MSFLAPIIVPDLALSASPWQEFKISDFSGGLCTAFPKSSIRDNQFSALTNYYIEDNGAIKVRGPFRPYLVTSQESVSSSAPLSFRWVKLGTTGYLLAYRSGALERWTGTAWADVVEQTAITSTPQFIKFTINDQEDVIICNGTDTPQRWLAAGSTTTDLGLTAPSLGGAAGSDKGTDQTKGLGTGGIYYYKFTYWYESSTSTKYGESNPSSSISVTVSSPATAGNYRAVNLSSLPAVSGDVTRLYIYRSPVDNSSGPYRQVGYITSGTTFTDNMPEGEEDVELPIDNGAVPKLENAVFFKGRLWGKDGNVPKKGIYSAAGNADLIPALNLIYFPDNLIGPVPFGENIYWFTEKQIYVTPNGDTDAYPTPVKICDRGCASYRAIVDVGNGLVFPSEDNVYWVDFNTRSLRDGDYPIAIGEPIKDKIQDIPITSRDKSVACLHREKYIISFTSSSSTSNDTTLAWMVKPGTYLLHQNLAGAWSYLDWDANDLQDFDGLLYSADASRNYIMEHDFAAAAGVDYYTKTEYDAATSHNISTQLSTKRLHFGHEWSDKIIRSLSLAADTSGITYIANFDFNDGDFQKSKSITLGSGTATSGEAVARYGTAIYGTSTYASDPYGFYSSHTRIPRGSKGKNALLTLDSSNSQDTTLSLMKLYYKIYPSP